MKDLYLYSATSISNLLTIGKITIQEYVESLAERTRLKEPSAKAWEYFNEELFVSKGESVANSMATGRSERKLVGIPVGIKDIFNTADMPTSMGSPIWQGFTPGNNARVVDDIIYEGGIPMGKTVTAEFAVHHSGKTLNPHNPNHIPGTSSSGSAVAVATGMVPLALGTQTAGSTSRPASYCGVYGYKPSFGIVPRTGILKTLDTLDHVTIFSRKVNDTRMLLDTIRVKGKNHPFIYENIDCVKSDAFSGSKIKIAFIKTYVWENAKDYMQKIIEKFASDLGGLDSVIVDEVELPTELTDTHINHDLVYSKALSYYFSDEYNNNYDMLSDSFKKMIEYGKTISKEEYFDGLKHQVKAQKAMDDFFADYDIVLSMSTVGEAPYLNEPEELPDTALIWTYVHTPSLNVPISTGPNNLPVSIQLVSRRYNDYKLLAFVEMLEQNSIIPTVNII